MSKKTIFSVILFLSVLLSWSSCNKNKTEIQAPSFTLLESELRIEEGKSASINVSVKSEDQRKMLKFSSFNPEIATVSSEGVVTGIKAGETQISVKLNELSKIVRVEVVSSSDHPKDSKLKIVLVTGYDNEAGRFVYEEIPNQILSTKIFEYHSLLLVYDGKEVVSTMENWTTDNPEMVKIETGAYGDCSLNTNIILGTASIRASYNDEEASIKVDINDNPNIFKKLYMPCLDPSYGIEKIKQWEKENHGTFHQEISTTDENTGEKYKLYSFSVNDPSDDHVFNRAYLIPEAKGTIHQAYVVVRPSSFVYDISEGYDATSSPWSYNFKSQFFNLLAYNGVLGIQASLSGDGYAKCLFEENDKLLTVYPNNQDSDDEGKILSVVLDYRLADKNDNAESSLKYLPSNF